MLSAIQGRGHHAPALISALLKTSYAGGVHLSAPLIECRFQYSGASGSSSETAVRMERTFLAAGYCASFACFSSRQERRRGQLLSAQHMRFDACESTHPRTRARTHTHS